MGRGGYISRHYKWCCAKLSTIRARMVGLPVLSIVAFCSLAFAGSPLKGELTSAGIKAVFPGDSGYGSASTACTSFVFSLT